MKNLEGVSVLLPQLKGRRTAFACFVRNKHPRVDAQGRTLFSQIAVDLIMDADVGAEHIARGASQFFTAAGNACSK